MAEGNDTSPGKIEPNKHGCAAGQVVQIRLATNDESINTAVDLVKRMYSQRGYGTVQSGQFRSDGITFLASVNGAPVGTLTLNIDADAGLLSDETFGEAVALQRSRGRKLCELTKFAVSTTAPSKSIVAALFNTAFIFGRTHGCTDVVIEVNPRHRRFYERMGFEMLGEMRTNARVNAPACLLTLSLDYAESQVFDSLFQTLSVLPIAKQGSNASAADNWAAAPKRRAQGGIEADLERRAA